MATEVKAEPILRRPPMAYLHELARETEHVFAKLRQPMSKHGRPLSGQRNRESKQHG